MKEPLNVKRRVHEEQMRTDRLVDIGRSNMAMVRCEWEVARLRTDAVTKDKYETKAIVAEMEQGNKELILVRRARMAEFLAAEAAEFEAQLNERGLAFAKVRP